MARADYFRKYCQIDVALDPFPYNGATTTCDAMWMGVPVVALAGKTCVSRHAEAVVRAAGVGELVGRDEEEYVKIAAELARDVGRMVELRGMLRSGLRSAR
jgi:predicted O-linked N-acetylglucosamine transferase (SPINDLY family)